MIRILVGDCRERLKELTNKSVQLCVTSPPYYSLRDYGADGQLGLEPTPDEYIDNLVGVFSEVRRTLKDTGALVLNLGDSYSGGGGYYPDAPSNQGGSLQSGGNARGIKNIKRRGTVEGLPAKNLLGIPWRVALALQADGWFLRSAMVWIKGNSMPESVRDRPTTAHEYVFLLAKSAQYFWDAEAIRVPHKQESWTVMQSAKSNKPGWSGNPNVHGEKGHPLPGHPSGRNYRTSDLFNTSLDLAIEQQRAHLAHLEHVRDNGGLMLDENGDPVALMVNTAGFSGAHFAVMPTALVDPFVRAGTSERGECSQCGAAWERVVERTGHINKRETAHVPGNSSTKTDSTSWQPMTRATNDWQPTCSCGAGDPVPQTVLDPFGGAGTTGLVADRLQRHAILCELNPNYAEMARERLVADGGMFTRVEVV